MRRLRPNLTLFDFSGNLIYCDFSGNLIHCDFGECFDVSRDREKYPEKVPFRLTRMMQKAMEVTGIHGTYTLTCNDVMEVHCTVE